MIRAMLKKKFSARAGQSGESLVEVLVAMTVASLAMIMLAMAIAVSTNIVSTSAQAEKTYYSHNSALANMGSSATSAITVEADYGGGTKTSISFDVSYGTQTDAPGMKRSTVIAYEAQSGELKEG